jgi:hypothetical protein
MEYVDNSILSIKASNEKKSSDEINIDISQNVDKIFENSFGKFKVSIVNEIKSPKSAKYWQCNLLVTEITNITKKG